MLTVAWQLLTITWCIFTLSGLLLAISLFMGEYIHRFAANTCGHLSHFKKQSLKKKKCLKPISLIVSELQEPRGLDLSPAESTVKCYVSSWLGLYKSGAQRPHTALRDPAMRVNKPALSHPWHHVWMCVVQTGRKTKLCQAWSPPHLFFLKVVCGGSRSKWLPSEVIIEQNATVFPK